MPRRRRLAGQAKTGPLAGRVSAQRIPLRRRAACCTKPLLHLRRVQLRFLGSSGSGKLLNLGIKNLPHKLERATWLNYVRCHDDIGLGFADKEITAFADFDNRQLFAVDNPNLLVFSRTSPQTDTI